MAKLVRHIVCPDSQNGYFCTLAFLGHSVQSPCLFREAVILALVKETAEGPPMPGTNGIFSDCKEA
jgi:hypothetical protein